MASGDNSKRTVAIPGTVGRSPADKQSDAAGDEYEDETLSERLWGLTEMFPETVRKASYNIGCRTKSGLKALYNWSRSATWLFFSTAAILAAPILFEVERAQVEEAQKSQQRQFLLGANTAVTSPLSTPVTPPGF